MSMPLSEAGHFGRVERSGSTSRGTDVTTVFGRYNSFAFSMNADWLWRNCVAQPVTNSGMTTVMMSSGSWLSSSSRKLSTGRVSSR